jgi:trehalose 6-phosphate synthase
MSSLPRGYVDVVTAEDRSLVVVSNRLPVQRAGGSSWKLSAGGLVTAMRPVVATRPTTWVGWDGGSKGVPEKLPDSEVSLVPVPLSREVVRRYYDGFANGTVWPLFHDLVGTPVFDSDWWRAYVEANRTMAQAAAEALQALPGRPVLWVHDYHLMMLPQMAREAGARDIRFFMHIPWPPPELFHRLPWRAEILRGLLGADALGFHTERYRKNFVRSCGRLLDDVTVQGRNILLPDGRLVRTHANPISIDVAEFTSEAGGEAAASTLTKLRRQFDGRRVLLGVDRLDYTKGILERLLAFERLLERRPDLRGTLAMVQIAIPTRGSVEEYRALREQVEQTIGRVNGTYTEPGEDVPVHYFHRGVSRPALLAYYQLADQMLVTPLKDGMNLVAKEYVVVQQAARGDGVLVLSEFTGAADELREACPCNPFDVEGLSEVMERVLEHDVADRRSWLAAMARRVRRADIHRWAARELADLGTE